MSTNHLFYLCDTRSGRRLAIDATRLYYYFDSPDVLRAALLSSIGWIVRSRRFGRYA